MKTILLLFFWFLLIANYSYSKEPCIYITYINGTIDTLTFSNNDLFKIVMDSIETGINEDSELNPFFNKPNNDKIGNYDNRNKLSIFPNPVISSFSLTRIPAGVMTFEIYDSFGIKLIEGKLENEINVEFLPSGLYFLKLNNQGEPIKFIKI